MRPCRRLHREILSAITVVEGALDLVRVPHVAVVGFHALARQEVAGEGVQEDLDVRPGAGGIRPLYPDKISLEDIDPQLIPERRLARKLMGAEDVPLLGGPLLLDAEVGAVDCHETIVQLVVDKTALEIDLWFRERATTMQRRW